MSKQIPVICHGDFLEMWHETAENQEQALTQAAQKVLNNLAQEDLEISPIKGLHTPNPSIEIIRKEIVEVAIIENTNLKIDPSQRKHRKIVEVTITIPITPSPFLVVHVAYHPSSERENR